MARFVGHESCPKCGSRDNLGRYDDGSAFCFGCHWRERATHAPRRYEKLDEDERSIPQLPDDTDTNFSAQAVQWLSQYHVSVEQAIQANIRWSESRQQLIFLLEDGCWQARNFNKEIVKQKRKYFTAGDVNDSIKVYGGRTTGTLAVVEDCVSALRISPIIDAMPVLGSHVASQRLNRIARLYSSLIIWLDHDKLKEARDLARRAQLIGLDTKVIYTELDPKCYSHDELQLKLNST